MRLLAYALMLALPAFTPAQAAPPASTGKSHDVVMYTTRDCGYCVRARQFLQERGVAWREIDIEASAANQREFAERGGQGTPLIFIDRQRVAGFNPQQMAALLAD